MMVAVEDAYFHNVDYVVGLAEVDLHYTAALH
jgi:hypothetical protein